MKSALSNANQNKPNGVTMKTAFAASIRKSQFLIAVDIAFNAANVNAATDLPVQQWTAL